jgi:diguanylate cyclase
MADNLSAYSSTNENDILADLVDSLAGSPNLEQLTRALLRLLGEITGLESTYLTQVDLDLGLQHVVFSHNTKAMVIPESLTVDWNDTLCKRALDEDCHYTDNVSKRWADSDAARDLGIETYVSVPIYIADRSLYGTLCAASAEPKKLSKEAHNALRLVAAMIAQFAERDRLLDELYKLNSDLSDMALTDSLTLLPNRRAFLIDLERLFAHARRIRSWVLVAFVDMDNFKMINDTYGHETGDVFLQQMSHRIKSKARAGDFLARLGGDEFVLAGEGPSLDVDGEKSLEAMRKRIFDATVAKIDLPDTVLDYLGASVGVVSLDPYTNDQNSALQAADKAMYQSKQNRLKHQK